MRTRVPIRVRPNARRTHVGGSWGSDRVLVVAVAAPPTDGRANKAVTRAIAGALDVPRRTVSIARGARSRDKVIFIDDPPADLDERVEQLRSM